MKKILSRFRNLLIRKLGGIVPVQHPSFTAMQLQLHTFAAVIDWHFFVCVDEKTREQRVRQEISEKLAEQIMKENMLQLSFTDNEFEQRRIYRASITVVDPRSM